MGTRTWEFKVNGQTVMVKAKKSLAKSFTSDLHRITNIHQYNRELTGVIGSENRWEKESSSVMMSMFSGSGYKLENPEKFETDKTEFFSSFPQVVTVQDMKGLLQKANAIFKEHCPVVDNRRTLEQETLRVKESNEATEKRNQESKSRAELIGLGSDEEISLEPGKMFVIIQAYFNDSNMMTDYSNPHSSIGPRYALAMVRDGKQLETTSRRIVSQIPELNALEWSWHKQNYSMGHGYWLESGCIGDIKHHAYDGRSTVSYWYEVKMDSFSKSMTKSKHFITETYQAPADNHVEGVTVSENEEKDGIEIRFPGKPDEDVRDTLKSHGFRWSRFGKCWYKRRSPEAIELAHSLAA